MDDDDTYSEFSDAVNLTAKQIESWLDTDESKEVGQKKDGGESTGHEMGRRILEVLRTRKGELSDDDAAHMRKVVGYVKRHSAQRPDKSDDELAHAKWTSSLKNWGHDPLK